MKRFLISLLIAATAFIQPIGASAFQWVISPGETLSSIARENGVTVKDVLRANAGIRNPDLIYAGDKLEIPSQKLGAGYSPVTGYSSRVSTFLTSVASTIFVVSTKDPSGLQISMASMPKVYMNLEAGTSNEELVYCTGVTASSWTGCVRGLAFQGGTMTASTTLVKAHNAGASVIISNIGQFYGEYASVSGDQTFTGLNTFNQYPVFAVGTTVPTSSAQFATKYYVDSVGAGGFTAANVSTTRGLSVDGSVPERVGIDLGATSTLRFIAGKLSLDSASSVHWTATQNIDALVATATAQALQITTDPVTANDAVRGSYVDSKILYGDSSDGAFAQFSGTTTIGTLTKHVYQYSSFQLGGTSTLTIGAFNQPVFVLVNGDFTVTSTSFSAVYLDGLGGAGGTGTNPGVYTGGDGTLGGSSINKNYGGGGGGSEDASSCVAACGGGGGSYGGDGEAGSVGTGATTLGASGAKGVGMYSVSSTAWGRHVYLQSMGGGGGGGGGAKQSSYLASGGKGGAGGGSIVFIVKGNVQIATSTFSAKGIGGSAGTSSNNANAGGGGGGAGGFVGVFYSGSLIQNNGTFTVTGGAVGTRSSFSCSSGAGATGTSVVQKIIATFGI
jgi:LysM repeat protein